MIVALLLTVFSILILCLHISSFSFLHSPFFILHSLQQYFELLSRKQISNASNYSQIQAFKFWNDIIKRKPNPLDYEMALKEVCAGCVHDVCDKAKIIVSEILTHLCHMHHSHLPTTNPHSYKYI